MLAIGFGLSNATFVTGTNVTILLQQGSITAVIATGMTLVVMTGGIDLSVGAILAASAATALAVSFLPYLGMLGILAGLAVGLALGCVNGWAVATLRLPSVLVTLTTYAAVRALVQVGSGGRPIANPLLPFAVIGNSAIVGVPLLAVVGLAVAAVAWFILRRTALGTRIRAAGGAADLPALGGGEKSRALMAVYAASGLLAGLGGVMSASRLFAANTLEPGQSWLLDAVAAVLIGGTRFKGGAGSLPGTLVAALIMAVLTDGLVIGGVSDAAQLIVKVLVILAVLALDRLSIGG